MLLGLARCTKKEKIVLTATVVFFTALSSSDLWQVTLGGQRLSKAVVGGKVPRRLAQQTVSCVLQQLRLRGKSSELGAERDAVAV